MHRDARAQALAALREVYDGSWTRHVGTGGGQTLHWEGKVGLIAGVTPTIDRHHAVMAAMGERFLLLRLPTVASGEQARWALSHAGREKTMRGELAGAVVSLFDRALDEPRPLSEEETGRLVATVELVVRARSAVERDSYSREVELIPDPEAPTRLIIMLERLLAGLDSIGVNRDDAWRVVSQVAVDCIPALRFAALCALNRRAGQVTTKEIAEAIGYPTTTARRALEDVHAHGLVSRHGGEQGSADRWNLESWASERLNHAIPEKSFETLSTHIKSIRLFGSPWEPR